MIGTSRRPLPDQREKISLAAHEIGGVQEVRWERGELVIDFDYCAGAHGNETPGMARGALATKWAQRGVADVVGSNYRLHDVTLI